MCTPLSLPFKPTPLSIIRARRHEASISALERGRDANYSGIRGDAYGLTREFFTVTATALAKQRRQIESIRYGLI